MRATRSSAEIVAAAWEMSSGDGGGASGRARTDREGEQDRGEGFVVHCVLEGARENGIDAAAVVGEAPAYAKSASMLPTPMPPY